MMLAQIAQQLKKHAAAGAETLSGRGRQAAVLVPLIAHGGALEILFTKRSENVDVHKGQIAFPGGVHESCDASLQETALREANEEVGIRPEQVEILGTLNPILTPTQFEVLPFVGVLHERPELVPNREEVHDIFFAPLTHFLAAQHLRLQPKTYFGHEVMVPFFSFGEHEIWGATGFILQQLILLI